MDLKDLRKKNKIELTKLATEKRVALNKFKFEVIGGKAKNNKTGRNIRKEIAQILTVIKEMNIQK